MTLSINISFLRFSMMPLWIENKVAVKRVYPRYWWQHDFSAVRRTLIAKGEFETTAPRATRKATYMSESNPLQGE